MASAPAAAPTAPSPTPAAGGSSAPQPGGSGPEPRPQGAGDGGTPFDARSDVADLFDGADPGRADELAQQALGDDGGRQGELPDGLDEAESQDQEPQQGIDVGGIHFRDEAHLAQYIQTQHGRLQSLNEQIENGREWEAYATQLEQQLAGGGQAPEGQAPEAMQQGQRPASGDVREQVTAAFLQHFTPAWYQGAEEAFVRAVSAGDEGGVRQNFKAYTQQLVGTLAELMTARETASNQRWQQLDAERAEYQQTESRISELRAVRTKALAARDPQTGQHLFSSLVSIDGSGRMAPTPLGQQLLPQIDKVMVSQNFPATVDGYARAFAQVYGLYALGGGDISNATAPAAKPRSAGDPSLSGTGIAPAGAPRRPAAMSDRSGLPLGPARGRTLGVRR